MALQTAVLLLRTIIQMFTRFVEVPKHKV